MKSVGAGHLVGRAGPQSMNPPHPLKRSERVLHKIRLFGLALALTGTMCAHDPGLGTAQLELRNEGLVATLGYAPGDLRPLLPPSDKKSAANLSESDFKEMSPVLHRLAAHLIEIKDSAGIIPWTGDSVSLASANSIMFRLTTSRRPKGLLELRSLVLDRLPPGHRDYVSITDEKGTLLFEKLIGAHDGPVSVNLGDADAAKGSSGDAPEERQPPTFWGFLRLGIAHIWTGYDHLLFLFGLLIVCRSFRSIVGIISCFTVAHSITLALATLNIVNIPSAIVEPMIAASIFYVGVENLIRRGAEPKGRWALTFGFGLIHGFGFASVLRELGIGSNGHGLLMPLFTFNLGVEIGQVSIAALVLPVVWQLRKNPTFVRVGVPILSWFVALAGLYWFVQRVFF
jgi:hydrogenase/urease accessory protein HupE